MSVVYRGCAIPVAWVAMPANKPGKWIDPACEPLDSLSVVIPTTTRAIAMTDRGLRSPKLWEKIRSFGWRPYMRQRINATFRIDGGKRMPARRLVSEPGNSFIGSGTAFSAKSKRLLGTIIVIWDEGQDEPLIILTDLPPMEAGASWCEIRFWIETGFKVLKSVGWQWRKTRRTDPARVELRWFVLSVATLLTLAFGSRVEDANALKRNPSALRAPPKRRLSAIVSRACFSPWHGDAEPPLDQGQDATPRLAVARTVAASAGGREGRLPPRTPKPTPISPSSEKARVTRAARKRGSAGETPALPETANLPL